MSTHVMHGSGAETARGRGDFARGVNIGTGERVASAVAGGLLTLWGATRGSLAGLAVATVGGVLVYRGLSGYCAVCAALGIDRRPGAVVQGNLGVKVDRTVTVDAPPEQVFRFWRNLENLPRFMSHLESVERVGDRRSHWVVRGPAGARVEWDAEILNETPNELIAWRSVQRSDVDHAGSVRFEPMADGRGTVVRVSLQYDPPGGVIGHQVAAFLGEDAARQIAQDLDGLKHAIEAWQAAGRGDRAEGQHIA